MSRRELPGGVDARNSPAANACSSPRPASATPASSGFLSPTIQMGVAVATKCSKSDSLGQKAWLSESKVSRLMATAKRTIP